ncbi:hypothetical protein ILUMI_13737, partial [Ignelater luminosus]
MAVASSQSAAAIHIGNVGSLSEFNPADNWTIYQKRLEQFFVGNGVAQDRKIAVLLTLIGSKAYGVLRDICDPQKPSELSYDSLCQKLTQQFSIQTSVFRQRCHFYNLNQIQSEIINDWFARVKKTATECQFGSVLDEKVKDKFVTGLINGPILDRLCEEDHKQSLSSLVQIAVNLENTNVIFRTYDGNVISPIGKFCAKVTFKEHESSNYFTVVDSGNRPLIGRDLISILHQFSELFQDKLGAYNACKVDFKVKEDTLPIFCKPRILPFAFRELVDKELNRLEAEDIITKVENNDW